MVRCCNLRQEAIASCIIPICLGILFLLTAFADLKSVAFVGVCLIFGAVTLATGILGVVGVSAKATTAIEVAVPLLAIENSVAVIVGCILLINVIFLKKYQPSATTTTTSYGETQTSNLTAALTNPENAHMATFLTSETTSTEATIQKYHWLGYFIAVLFILLGLLGFFVNQLLGAYKTELSVDQLVAERKTLWKQFEAQPSPSKTSKDEERKPLLDISKTGETTDMGPITDRSQTVETADREQITEYKEEMYA